MRLFFNVQKNLLRRYWVQPVRSYIKQIANATGGKPAKTTPHSAQCFLLLPDHAEEINVGIVHAEIDENDPSSTIKPQVILQILNQKRRCCPFLSQILVT